MGRVLAGRYELKARLGRGGMGEVWSARDNVIERDVAVKLLQAHLDDDSGAQLFFREARTAGALNHAGIITVYDLGRDGDGTLFLVMELVRGRNLGQVLAEDGLPPVARAVEWAAQAADALAAAHRARIVHRDLKPANIMLTDAGAVKVLDFGIARSLDTGGLTSTHIIGTLAYMPPERFNTGHQDARGDLYSLGCVLHELLTGTTPFGDLPTTALMFAHAHRIPDPPSTHRTDVPGALDALVARLLAKNPDERPADADEVRDHLHTLAEPAAAGPTQPGQRGPRPRAQRGQDALIRLEITPQEAAFGTIRELPVDTAVTCTTCHGEGAAPHTSTQTCDTCHGRGEVSRISQSFMGPVTTPHRCRPCKGFGTVIPTPCPECAGDGRVRARRTLTVRIPAGIVSGTRLQLPGAGEVGPGGGPAGDVYVEIVTVEPGLFSRLRDAFNGR